MSVVILWPLLTPFLPTQITARPTQYKRGRKCCRVWHGESVMLTAFGAINLLGEQQLLVASNTCALRVPLKRDTHTQFEKKY